MEKVLNIDLLRDEIYGYLTIVEKRKLRLCSRLVWKLTLPNWRKTVAVRISCWDSHPRSISLPDFYSLFKQNQVGKEGDDFYLLEEYPYKNYILYGWNVSPFKQAWHKFEQFFWEKCAANLITLSFEKCYFYYSGFHDVYKWIVTRGCPALENLKFKEFKSELLGNVKKGYTDITSKIFSDINNEKESCYIEDYFEKGDYANTAINLKSLSLYLNVTLHLKEERAKEILQVAPNLQTLDTNVEELLDGIETLSLKNLHLTQRHLPYRLSDIFNFTKFVSYTAAHPHSLKRVKITNINFIWSMRDKYFLHVYQLFKGISQCQALSSLDLSVTFPNLNNKWFTSLTGTEFPVLKELKISFGNGKNTDLDVRFDFETLKLAPNLKSLEVKYLPPPAQFKTRKGTGNWLQSKEECLSLRLEHLQRFYFNGWPLNSDDLQIFREWFPSVKHLTAGFNSKAHPTEVIETFQYLQSLSLTSSSETHQGKLFEAKIKYGDKVRIFLEGGKLGRSEVVQEKNEEGIQTRFIFQPLELNWVDETSIACQEDSDMRIESDEFDEDDD